MNLEDLVPPLELCKQIPEGKFKDSALVWWNKTEPSVYPREDVPSLVIHGYSYPAPTLQEILREMASHPNKFRMITVEVEDPNDFTVVVQFHDYWRDFQYDKNPATAALKLWLEVNKPDTPDRKK